MIKSMTNHTIKAKRKSDGKIFNYHKGYYDNDNLYWIYDEVTSVISEKEFNDLFEVVEDKEDIFKHNLQGLERILSQTDTDISTIDNITFCNECDKEQGECHCSDKDILHEKIYTFFTEMNGTCSEQEIDFIKELIAKAKDKELHFNGCCGGVRKDCKCICHRDDVENKIAKAQEEIVEKIKEYQQGISTLTDEGIGKERACDDIINLIQNNK